MKRRYNSVQAGIRDSSHGEYLHYAQNKLSVTVLYYFYMNVNISLSCKGFFDFHVYVTAVEQESCRGITFVKRCISSCLVTLT